VKGAAALPVELMDECVRSTYEVGKTRSESDWSDCSCDALLQWTEQVSTYAGCCGEKECC
jgi:hypothetical protein